LKTNIFHIKKVDFLDHVIATDRVTINNKKMESIKALRAPISVKDVQIFIGFANFCRLFITKFAAIDALITNLPKRDPKTFFSE